jgi:enoyl-CoA hydratase/carnithine racemase
MSEFVRVETEEAVATIRLDRPPMNALNAQLRDELAQTAQQVAADDGIRAVVPYGGPKVFAAGADIKEMAEAGGTPPPPLPPTRPRLIGPARARDIVYTGRFVAAAEALAIGLADRVVPDADVYQAARELVGRFAAGPAEALRAGMRSFIENGPGKARFSGR